MTTTTRSAVTLNTLPPELLTHIFTHLDGPSLDRMVVVSKVMAPPVNEARRQFVEQWAKQPGRFTNEKLPTRSELHRFGIPDPNLANVLRTCAPLLSPGPAQPESIRERYEVHAGVHIRLVEGMRRLQEFGGVAKRTNLARQTSHVGQVDATGRPHGYGWETRMVPPSLGARFYQGDYHEGQWHGLGFAVTSNSSLYEGWFVNGRLRRGIQTDANGTRYGGPYENGKPNGQGVLVQVNGNTYEGPFVNGRITGKGIAKNANGDIWYEGEFLNGEFHGKGTRTYEDGFIYEGDFVNSQRTGKGILKSKNGDVVYKGAFLNGKFHGQGIGTYPNGDIYEGPFVNGNPHGQGILVNKYGERYKVTLNNGREIARELCSTFNAV